MIEAQLSAGMNRAAVSEMHFRASWERLLQISEGHVLKAAWIDTKLGP